MLGEEDMEQAEKGDSSGSFEKFSSVTMRPKQIQISLCILTALLIVPFVTLPIVGSAEYFETFSLKYSPRGHMVLLTRRLAGPAVAALAVVALFWMSWIPKKIPWFIPGIGISGAIYGLMLESGRSHDFSHAVFKECSGIYGLVMKALGTSIAIMITAIFFLGHRMHSRRGEQALQGGAD